MADSPLQSSMRSYSHIGLNPKLPINSQTHGTDHISIYSDIAANMFLSYHGHDESGAGDGVGCIGDAGDDHLGVDFNSPQTYS